MLIQKMVELPAHEFVLGGLLDYQFGPTVMFGVGISLELLKYVSFKLTPLEKSALRMIKSILSSALLEGYLGSPLSQRI